MKHYSLIVIGAGPGGSAAALRAAELGLSVACIEKRAVLGGSCLNEGCIPSKAVIHSSKLYSFLQTKASEHGIKAKVSLDFVQMMKRKEEVVSQTEAALSSLFSFHKIQRYEGKASFLSPHEISITEGKNKKTISGDSIILATGSETRALPDFPFDEIDILSSKGALSLQEVPPSLCVLGAGVIGLELASLYARLGSQVTLVESASSLFPHLSRGTARAMLSSLQKQGLSFLFDTQLISLTKKSKQVHLSLINNGKETSLITEKILIAIGRQAQSSSLALDKTKIQANSQGQIPVDAHFRTTEQHIYAIGDLIEGPMLAHKAEEEGRAAAEIIAGKSADIHYTSLPSVIYTSPELAWVGLSEKECKEAGIDIKISIAKIEHNPHAHCTSMGELSGFIQILSTKNKGRILGAEILAPCASELISQAGIAIRLGSTIKEICSVSRPHPSYSESFLQAARKAL